jgi:hypothetical protein
MIFFPVASRLGDLGAGGIAHGKLLARSDDAETIGYSKRISLSADATQL